MVKNKVVFLVMNSKTLRFPSARLNLITIATTFFFPIFSLSFISSLMAASDSRFSLGCDKKGIAEGKRSTAGSSTEIVLVRHGETDWNVTGKMQGQLNIDLNEVGRRQAASNGFQESLIFLLSIHLI
uniref:Phosphoserine phosphatase n=1 Tax=Opuntia streptacantha TaxID=393608 RepID=A0A7C9ALQ7_OPUST